MLPDRLCIGPNARCLLQTEKQMLRDCFLLPERKVVTMGDDGDDDFGTGPAVILIVTTVTIVTLRG